MGTNLILAFSMALFGVLGYIYGSGSALLTAIVVWVGMLVAARLGGSVESILEGLYKAARFALSGGLGALSNSGDTQALVQAMKQVGATGPLLGGNQHASTLLLLGAGVVLVVLFGRHPRLRRPPSLLGLLLGLLNGYLVGGFVLVALVGPTAAALPLPFGLSAAAASGASVEPTLAIDSGGQLVHSLQNASQGSLSSGAEVIITALVLVSVGGQREGTRQPQTQPRSRLGSASMGPVETLFLVLMAFFGVIGIVRGFHRELGVTTMLLLALLVIKLAEDRFGHQFNGVLALVTGDGVAQLPRARAVVWVLFLIVIAFVSYEGDRLAFPGRGTAPVLGLLIGLLNGYLFAGSMWYYLAQAGWPLLQVSTRYTDLYGTLSRLLPPALLNWPFLIGIVVIMVLFRAWE